LSTPGVLFAAADADEPRHGDCANVLRTRRTELLVVAPVVAEAAWPIEDRPGPGPDAEAAFVRPVARADLPVIDLRAPDYERCVELIDQYADPVSASSTHRSSPSQNVNASGRWTRSTTATSEPSGHATSKVSNCCPEPGCRETGLSIRPGRRPCAGSGWPQLLRHVQRLCRYERDWPRQTVTLAEPLARRHRTGSAPAPFAWPV